MLPKTRKIRRGEGATEGIAGGAVRATAGHPAGTAPNFLSTQRKQRVWAGGRSHPGSGLAPLEAMGEEEKERLRHAVLEGARGQSGCWKGPLTANPYRLGRSKGWKTAEGATLPRPLLNTQRQTTGLWRTHSRHWNRILIRIRTGRGSIPGNYKKKGKGRFLVDHGHLSIPMLPLEMLLKWFKRSQGKKHQRGDNCREETTKVWKTESQWGGDPVGNRQTLEPSHTMGPQLRLQKGWPE